MESYNWELQRRVDDLESLHNDESMPSMRENSGELAERIRHETAGLLARRSSRRGFLLGAGVAAGAAVLAACGSASSASQAPATTAAPSRLKGDLLVAALSASLENLGIYAYAAGISAAKAGKLGTVPPAVVNFAQVAMAQHKEHTGAWNGILTAAGVRAVTKTDPALTPTVQQAFSKVTDVTGLANLALEIENIAAATYQDATAVLTSKRAVGVAASIQPVELEHAAILNFVLGKYPVPNAFSSLAGAQPPASYYQ
ncbi:MAG: ferritin-like domain-containing protein [Actinomycetota bacterium]|nr:ferritin-like domain-containing protein [Actinomycetota bacterium]MDA8209032.1 ferritin-like domain-containing protein [Actinomycetota bacterium]